LARQADFRSQSHAVGFIEDNPANRSTAGFKMCVLGGRPEGARWPRPQCVLLSCPVHRQAKGECRSRQPAADGAVVPEYSSQLRRRKRPVMVVRRGKALASGMNVTAPAHSRRSAPASRSRCATDAQVAAMISRLLSSAERRRSTLGIPCE